MSSWSTCFYKDYVVYDFHFSLPSPTPLKARFSSGNSSVALLTIHAFPQHLLHSLAQPAVLNLQQSPSSTLFIVLSSNSLAHPCLVRGRATATITATGGIADILSVLPEWVKLILQVDQSQGGEPDYRREGPSAIRSDSFSISASACQYLNKQHLNERAISQNIAASGEEPNSNAHPERLSRG